MWESPCSALASGDGTAGCGQKVRLFSRLLHKPSGFRQAEWTKTENPVISTCPAQGQKLGASPWGKQVFPVISRRAVYRKTLAKFGAFPVKNFCCNSSGPMPTRPCSPFGLIHIPEEQPYDTLIPDFRESRENSERPFLCRRVFLAFPCEIISNHDSVNYD